MTPTTTHTKILYGLVAVLFVALSVVLYQNERLQMTGSAPGAGSGGDQEQFQPLPSGVTIGGAGNTTNGTVVGTITGDQDNTLQVKDQDGNVKTVAITSTTQFTIAGKLKDQATRQQELDAYNAQLQVLLKDPEKNKAALAALQMPAAQISSPATASDFKVGDAVVIATSGADSNGVYAATIVTKDSGQ